MIHEWYCNLANFPFKKIIGNSSRRFALTDNYLIFKCCVLLTVNSFCKIFVLLLFNIIFILLFLYKICVSFFSTAHIILYYIVYIYFYFTQSYNTSN